jgi:uncharacterized iron-regulated membrane protein
VSVFAQEFERWQQPDIAAVERLDSNAITTAYQQLLARQTSAVKALWIMLPFDGDATRAHASDGQREWFIDKDGNLTQTVTGGWVEMIRSLHYYLHLPETFGMIVVGMIGVFFMALIISGILSHASIIKDAFKFRANRSHQLQQTDLHNRIGVWGLPFISMSAITGAFIGVANILIFSVATLYFNGDTDAVVDAVYGKDVTITGKNEPYNVDRALTVLAEKAPTAVPIYIAFHNPNTENQVLEIAATLPEKLVYSEIYRFDAAGNYINSQHLSDGPSGRQIAYSVYRLHFGQFDGFFVKVLYAIFGLATTILTVSGVNIWLSKRRYQTQLNQYWTSLVWGLPIAITSAAIIALWLPLLVVVAFWLIWLSVILLGPNFFTAQNNRKYLRLILGSNLILLAGLHYLHFGNQIQDATAHWVNITLVCLGIVIWKLSYNEKTHC